MEFGNMLMYNNSVQGKLYTLPKEVTELKLCIRAHDLGVKGTEAILQRLQDAGRRRRQPGKDAIHGVPV